MINKQEYKNKITGEVLPFQTKYSYENDKSEKNDMPSETDATLFVPLKKMVGNILRLDYISQMPFSVIDGSDEATTFEDPADAPGYDIADAFEDKQIVQDAVNDQSQQEEPKAEPVVQTETSVSGKIDSERNSNES